MSSSSSTLSYHHHHHHIHIIFIIVAIIATILCRRVPQQRDGRACRGSCCTGRYAHQHTERKRAIFGDGAILCAGISRGLLVASLNMTSPCCALWGISIVDRWRHTRLSLVLSYLLVTYYSSCALYWSGIPWTLSIAVMARSAPLVWEGGTSVRRSGVCACSLLRACRHSTPTYPVPWTGHTP